MDTGTVSAKKRLFQANDRQLDKVPTPEIQQVARDPIKGKAPAQGDSPSRPSTLTFCSHPVATLEDTAGSGLISITEFDNSTGIIQIDNLFELNSDVELTKGCGSSPGRKDSSPCSLNALHNSRKVTSAVTTAPNPPACVDINSFTKHVLDVDTTFDYRSPTSNTQLCTPCHVPIVSVTLPKSCTVSPTVPTTGLNVNSLKYKFPVRRTSRTVKPNSKYESFLTGGKKQRKRKIVAKTKKEIEEAIAKAGLDRCLHSDTAPLLSNEEGLIINNLCGIIPDAMVPTPPATIAQPIDFDSSECVLASLNKWNPDDSRSDDSGN